ncbi:neurofilament medium polypeptide-like isoform X2 [Scylla paramamosain]|uniref:neurofilament medium polypeptide-like isoform X2 n=1 Tax=Scylla paramamosain TaxID=85552 RepID=UPI00308315C2
MNIQGSSATTEGEKENVSLSVSRNKCTHSYPDPAIWLEESASEMLQDTQYGITYLERELHKMEQKKRAYTHFYKQAHCPCTPSPCPAPYFSARYHLEALKSPSANEKTREKVMGAFHAWYKGQMDAMMHYVNCIQTDLDSLASRDLVGMEMRTVSSTTKLIGHFHTFQSNQSKLPLNPRYLFLKYAHCLLPRVHTQVMHTVFEKMYGLEKASHLIHEEEEGKRRAALRVTYKVSQCVEEILRDARQALPEGIRTFLFLVYMEQKMQKLLSLLEEAVTTIEDSQEIFDILSWTEDVSWGVTTEGNYSHEILNLLVKDIETIDDAFTSSGDINRATGSDGSANDGVFQQDSSSKEHEEEEQEKERELEEILKEVLLSGCESLQVPGVVQYLVEEDEGPEEEEEEEEEIDILEEREKKEREIEEVVQEGKIVEKIDNKEEKREEEEEEAVEEEKEVEKVDGQEEAESEELEVDEEAEKGEVKERDKKEQEENGEQKDEERNGKGRGIECRRDVEECDVADTGHDHLSSPPPPPPLSQKDVVVYPVSSKGHHHHTCTTTTTTNTTSPPPKSDQTKYGDETVDADHDLPHLYSSPTLSPTSLSFKDMVTPSPPAQSLSPPAALSPKHPRKLASRTSFCHLCYYRRKHHPSRLPIYFPCRVRPQGYHIGYIEDAM